MAWFEHGTSRIYYEEQGSGTPVLVLPGFAGSIEEFAALREAMVMAGYRVIAADLPGSGRSEPQPRTYTATYYEDDAHSFAALLQHLASEPVHLMGFSDGGEISLLMATLTPGVVRSVVTWGAAGVINDPSGQLRQAMYNVVDNPHPATSGVPRLPRRHLWRGQRSRHDAKPCRCPQRHHQGWRPAQPLKSGHYHLPGAPHRGRARHVRPACARIPVSRSHPRGRGARGRRS
jgi:pimeloyl-ACP methyl ester carboxylesterase